MKLNEDKLTYLGSWCCKIFLGIFFLKSGAKHMNNALGHVVWK